ncbi:hypothetical protein [Oceanobacillus kapialis]|uniref:Uncharacterized protein n=1 Tax=Oceanobacillus kapialis TaxID=481353 RepID=A0ABW5PXV4_9BACI
MSTSNQTLLGELRDGIAINKEKFILALDPNDKMKSIELADPKGEYK